MHQRKEKKETATTQKTAHTDSAKGYGNSQNRSYQNYETQERGASPTIIGPGVLVKSGHDALHILEVVSASLGQNLEVL